jgi:hypothetical protein
VGAEWRTKEWNPLGRLRQMAVPLVDRAPLQVEFALMQDDGGWNAALQVQRFDFTFRPDDALLRLEADALQILLRL